MVENKDKAKGRAATPGKLEWDVVGNRYYETGVDRGVIFPVDANGKTVAGVAWSGLTKVAESPEGGEETALYADNIKYLSLYSVENLKGTIEAYMYPDEFAECDGSAQVVAGVRLGQQTRKPFGLSYRKRVGNDIEGHMYAYKIMLIYGIRVSPSEKSAETVNDTPGAQTFSWAFSATPQTAGDDFLPTAIVEIDSRYAPEDKLKALETKLYGAEAATASMPTVVEVMEMFKKA